MSQWLLSNKARTLFSYSSWAVVGLGLFFIFMWSPLFQPVMTTPGGEIVLRVLGGVSGIVGTPASLILWFGMVAFCLREDDSPISVKILWFALFFTTASFGAAAYFFKVYRKQVQQAGAAS